MPDVARLHTAYVWVPGGYGDRTNGLCINQTHGPHHWALQMTPVGQIDIHLQHAFLGVSGGSFGSQGVPFGSIHNRTAFSIPLLCSYGIGEIIATSFHGPQASSQCSATAPIGLMAPHTAGPASREN